MFACFLPCCFFRFVTVLRFFFFVFLSFLSVLIQLDEYLSDDFLFPMTSRLSYASSPESDLDLSPEPRPSGDGSKSAVNGGKSPPSPSSGGRMVKSSSDPSIATQDDLGVSGLSGASAGGLLNSMSPAAKFLSPHPINSIHPVSLNVYARFPPRNILDSILGGYLIRWRKHLRQSVDLKAAIQSTVSRRRATTEITKIKGIPTLHEVRATMAGIHPIILTTVRLHVANKPALTWTT